MGANVYQIVTDRIVEQMQQGIIPWQRPWHGSRSEAVSYATGRPYSFLNQMLLGRAGEWLTWNQIAEAGGKLKKGSKAGMVVFYKQLPIEDKEKKDENGNPKVKMIPFLRYTNVYHISDCEGVASRLGEESPTEGLQPEAEAERIVAEYDSREEGLTICREGLSNRAYYAPMKDMVVVPSLEQYDEVAEYYSTLFHELTHSTAHPQRCDRKSGFEVKGFATDDYSREELVAEVGAAMLVSRAGLDCDKAFRNSVAYLQGWLRALKNDNKMIAVAAAQAEKAARYIFNDKED